MTYCCGGSRAAQRGDAPSFGSFVVDSKYKAIRRRWGSIKNSFKSLFRSHLSLRYTSVVTSPQGWPGHSETVREREPKLKTNK